MRDCHHLLSSRGFNKDIAKVVHQSCQKKMSTMSVLVFLLKKSLQWAIQMMRKIPSCCSKVTLLPAEIPITTPCHGGQWTVNCADDIVDVLLNDVAYGKAEATGFHTTITKKKKTKKNGNSKKQHQQGRHSGIPTSVGTVSLFCFLEYK
jgi:hypothetical protein